MNVDSKLKKLSELFYSENKVEKILKQQSSLEDFWKKRDTKIIFRKTPSPFDPIYEIQLVIDLGDRFETYAWVWVEALEGRVLKIFPDK